MKVEARTLLPYLKLESLLMHLVLELKTFNIESVSFLPENQLIPSYYRT